MDSWGEGRRLEQELAALLVEFFVLAAGIPLRGILLVFLTLLGVLPLLSRLLIRILVRIVCHEMLLRRRAC